MIIKKLFSVLLTICLMFSIFLNNSSTVFAKGEEYTPIEGCVTVDVNDYKVGDSIVVFEDNKEHFRVVIDVIDYKPTITPYETGNSGWSGGNMPSGTHTLYPHIERTGLGHQKMGFYETVQSKSGGFKILEVYNPSIVTGIGVTVSQVKLKINQSQTSGSVTAKASMNWIAEEVVGHSTYNCYLMSEINSIGQHKLSWKF